MENLAKPTSGFLTVMGKFLLAILTIAALSGAVLVNSFEPRSGGEIRRRRGKWRRSLRRLLVLN